MHLEVEPVPLMTLRNYGMSEEQQTHPPKEILWVGAMWLLEKKKRIETTERGKWRGGVQCFPLVRLPGKIL